MIYVDHKYVSMIGVRLRNFKHKGGHMWNASCPICGDSKKNPSKARLYFYTKSDHTFVKCFKCSYSRNLGNFLKDIDEGMYREYKLEKMKGAEFTENLKKEDVIPDILMDYQKAPRVNTVGMPVGLTRIADLPDNHPARSYVRARMIPEDKHTLLYYCPKFKKFANSVSEGKYKNLDDDHPRLIIPFIDSYGECFAVTGRAFGREEPKYMTVRIKENYDMIFGMNTMDPSQPVLAVEGPIDSLFLPNCIAVAGNTFSSHKIEEIKNNLTIVYDNEPRSPTITKLIGKAINDGYKVCLFPDNLAFKDINEAVMVGFSTEELVSIIRDNTFQGVEAKLRFSNWKRC